MTLPQNYLIANQQQSKAPVIVVQIDGVDDVLVNQSLYTSINYGDPVTYGEAGIVYGGLQTLHRERSDLQTLSRS